MEIQMSKFKKWLILFNVSFSVFMATLDSSIVNIALPVISNDLSASISSVQWVVTSYLLTISAMLLVFGKISDMYGKKKIYAFGFIVFTIGSGLCGLSQSLGMLVFSRVLQALGAAAMMALSQGIITENFPPSERGRALGINGTTVAIGSLAGPSLGGVLVQLAGWQSIFYINIPIGIIGTILTFAIIPDIKVEPSKKKFDYSGAAFFISSIVLAFLGMLFMQDGKIPLEAFAVMMVIAAVLMVVFIRYEKRVENPLIDLSLFKNSIFSIGLISAFLSFVSIFSVNIFMPFFLQFVLGHNTLKAGLIMSFYPIATAVVAPLSGWLSDKITYRPLTVAGLTINTAALTLMYFLNPETSLVKIGLLMAIMGVGIAMFQSPNTSSIMGSVQKEQLGIAGGINALFRNLGMVSGTSMSVLIFVFATKTGIEGFTSAGAGFDTAIFMKGFKTVIVFAALSSLAGASISLIRSVGLKIPGKK